MPFLDFACTIPPIIFRWVARGDAVQGRSNRVDFLSRGAAASDAKPPYRRATAMPNLGVSSVLLHIIPASRLKARTWRSQCRNCFRVQGKPIKPTVALILSCSHRCTVCYKEPAAGTSAAKAFRIGNVRAGSRFRGIKERFDSTRPLCEGIITYQFVNAYTQA